MNDDTYKVVKTDLKSPERARLLEANDPWDAYRQVTDNAYRLIQADDIGSEDNPCVRFITRNLTTREKIFFYVKKVIK